MKAEEIYEHLLKKYGVCNSYLDMGTAQTNLATEKINLDFKTTYCHDPRFFRFDWHHDGDNYSICGNDQRASEQYPSSDSTVAKIQSTKIIHLAVAGSVGLTFGTSSILLGIVRWPGFENEDLDSIKSIEIVGKAKIYEQECTILEGQTDYYPSPSSISLPNASNSPKNGEQPLFRRRSRIGSEQ